MQDINGKDLKLSKYAGKVVLVVNVASACGFTPQYNELVELDKQYSSKGLVIIGAPCNQFGAQEPGSNEDIKKFAAARGAKFPMLSKLDVNGPDGTFSTVLFCAMTRLCPCQRLRTVLRPTSLSSGPVMNKPFMHL